MHEYVFAEGILDTAVAFAEKNYAKKILKIIIEVGELTFLNTEQLRFALEIISKNTIAEGCEIIIEKKTGKIRCNSCGYEGSIDVREEVHHLGMPLQVFSCPKCKSNNTEIIEGKECNIKSIEIEK